jgi:phosphoribosylanthranilate isomerase
VSRVRVKICGITRREDALAAAIAGADAIGLVFYPDSLRAVTPDRAAAITASLPPFVARVGLFVDPEPGFVDAVLAAVHLDLLQFHGSEAPGFCSAFGLPYIKAIRMRSAGDAAGLSGMYPQAAALLLDTYAEELAGGTGRTFDWTMIPRGTGRPLILAGGLSPENVESAILQVLPYAVDVSGGVESAKGIKDPARIRALMNAVDRAGKACAMMESR